MRARTDVLIGLRERSIGECNVMTVTLETASDQETEALAERLAKAAAPGLVISLDGELGAGKTVFARGFARGLGIREPVVSPTFTILHGYEEGRMPLWHFDVYRIEDPEEMAEIGYEDCFFGDGVSLVEWGSLIEELLPPDTVRVVIGKDPERGTDFRSIRIEDPAGLLGADK